MTNEELDSFLRSSSKYDNCLRCIGKNVSLGSGMRFEDAALIAAAFSSEAALPRSRFYSIPVPKNNLIELFRKSSIVCDENLLIPRNRGFTFSIHPRFFKAGINHRHNYIEFVYVYSGSITQNVGNLSVTLEEGDACILDTITEHSFGLAGEGDIIVNCLIRRSYFNTSILSKLAGESFLSHFIMETSFRGYGSVGYLMFRTGKDAALREAIQRVLREHFDPGPFSELILDSGLNIIFAELARIGVSGERDGNPGSDEYIAPGIKGRIPDILRFIRTGCASVKLSDAAEYFHISPDYLSAVLRRTLGKGFIDLLKEARLERAAVILISTDASVESVIHEVGYENVHYFNRIFKEKYGSLPSIYRRSSGNRLSRNTRVKTSDPSLGLK